MSHLKIYHQPQQQSADCLAACSAMLLSHLDIKFRYRRLLKSLKVSKFGTSFHNLAYLVRFGVKVTVGHGSMAQLEQLLTIGLPIIILIGTNELDYWNESASHAVVVVGYDETHIFINDPILTIGSQPVLRTTFELAWLEGDYLFATIEA